MARVADRPQAEYPGSPARAYPHQEVRNMPQLVSLPLKNRIVAAILAGAVCFSAFALAPSGAGPAAPARAEALGPVAYVVLVNYTAWCSRYCAPLSRVEAGIEHWWRGRGRRR